MLSIYLSVIDTQEKRNEFLLIYKLHSSLMYNIAYKILKNKTSAEDAVQEAFLAVAKNMDKISDAESLKTRNYLIMIVRNYALKIYNHNKDDSWYEISEEFIADGQDIEMQTESKDVCKKIFEIIKTLDSSYSDMLMLRFYYDLSEQEIAEQLNITLQNVRTRLSRARKKLKERLKEADIYE